MRLNIFFRFFFRRAEQQGAVAFKVALIGLHGPVFDEPEAVGHEAKQVHVVADENNRARVGGERFHQRFAAFDIKVVGWLIEDEQMRRIQRGQHERKAGLLAAGKLAHEGFGLLSTNAKAPKPRAQAGGRFRGAQAADVIYRGFVNEELIDLMLRKETDPQL